MQWRHSLFFISLVTATAVGFVGCDQVQKALNQIAGQSKSSKTENVTTSVPARTAVTGDTIRIASFNIQVFGESKMKKQDVVDVLVEVVRKFDIVAVQEIRASDQSIIPRFLEQVNSTGRHYDFLISERIGRTVSKEQYAYIYDAERIEVFPESMYTVADPRDLLHREPYVAGFRVRGVPSNEAFTFNLINIHTDPDETDQELDALDDVFRFVQNDGSGEDDIILLGDLNVDDRHLGELGRLPEMVWTVRGEPTNTRGNKSYDNILFNANSTVEFAGRAGVMRLQDEFGLDTKAALRVSDHQPVWAEFSVREMPSSRRLANQNGNTQVR